MGFSVEGSHLRTLCVTVLQFTPIAKHDRGFDSPRAQFSHAQFCNSLYILYVFRATPHAFIDLDMLN
jgi:hypothetical protein